MLTDQTLEEMRSMPIQKCIASDNLWTVEYIKGRIFGHCIMLFIIWLSFRLLLLVPNWETIFFLCSKLHFCTLDSDYCWLTTVDRISIILEGNHFTILLFSTIAIKYLPGSSTPLCDYIYIMRVLSSLCQLRVDSLPYLVPFIWLYWSMYIS